MENKLEKKDKKIYNEKEFKKLEKVDNNNIGEIISVSEIQKTEKDVYFKIDYILGSVIEKSFFCCNQDGNK